MFCHHWSDEKWKSAMAGGGGHKKRFQYSAGTILYLRALQGQSGRNLIDPSLQGNVVIPDGFFKYTYHVGCAINLHSIISSGLIPGGQDLSRQTVFFHKDPDTIDLNAPRHAQYMHKAWKKHQNTVYWVDINLVLKKGLKFYETRSNSIILHETLPAYCIPKVVRMETGEVIYEKSVCVTSASSDKEYDDDEQETSEMQFEDFALKTNVLALRADQRLKQNHKDVLLPAHPQELYPSGKESGLMLSQKIIRQSLAQCQNN